MRKPLHVAMGTIRFSLSRYTTGDEIDRAIAIAQRVVPEMRRASISSA
jgi:cysteine sulfinate desulfinase/cysteine desulfurase-like protein